MTRKEPVEVLLYNMEDDPYEHFNQAESYPEVVAELEAEMKRMAEELGATLWEKE